MPRKPISNGAQTDEDAIITAFDALHVFKRHMEDMDVYNETLFKFLEGNGTVEAMDALYDNLREIYRRVSKGQPIIPGTRPGLIADGNNFRDNVSHDTVNGYSLTS